MNDFAHPIEIRMSRSPRDLHILVCLAKTVIFTGSKCKYEQNYIGMKHDIFMISCLVFLIRHVQL